MGLLVLLDPLDMDQEDLKDLQDLLDLLDMAIVEPLGAQHLKSSLNLSTLLKMEHHAAGHQRQNHLVDITLQTWNTD